MADILDAPDVVRTAIAISLLERAVRLGSHSDGYRSFTYPVILGKMRDDPPPFDRDDLRLMLRLVRSGHRGNVDLPRLLDLPITALERYVAAGGDAGSIEREVRGLLDEIGKGAGPANQIAALRGRLLRALDSTDLDVGVFDVGDTWGVGMRQWALAHRTMPGLQEMLIHLASATSVAPTGAWRKRAAELGVRPGVAEMVRFMVDSSFDSQRLDHHALDASPFQPANSAFVRGAYWAAAVGAWPWVTETLGRAGPYWCVSGRNDNYARDRALANTCAMLLSEIGTTEAHAALGRMKAKVRNRTVAATVERALADAAEKAGTSPSELLELAVSRLGLDDTGRRELPIGGGAGILQLDADGDAGLTWRGPDGRVTGSPPKALVESQPAAIRAAKEELKELRKALSVERGRVEDLLIETRSWSYPVWRERYLGHPVTRAFASRLIWRFEANGQTTPGMPLGEEPVRVDGTLLELGDEATVSVWHPIHADVEEVRAWRTFLLERQIKQPFKQAFREIYIVTPAELETGTYSNRFAAHILDYPVARALMTARRWGSNFLGPYDGGYEGIAKHVFPTYGVRAEFAHSAVEEDNGDFGPVLRCSTDRVEFLRIGHRSGEGLPLGEIPPIVFSEAMRDVDLFVGVSSIAADANWQDGGTNRNFTAYWQATAFGDLTASAESRRDVLAWMIPQLAIADRLTLDDRHLRVRGDLRTYKIHLGSGNILMEPNDQYLCIVPGRSDAANKVFLPFDSDARLSLILSKAFLLAKDKAIRDPSIVAQLRR